MVHTSLHELQKVINLPMERAICLPFSSYKDSHIYEKERERIFHNDWIFVCAEKELAEIGDFFSFLLADEPVVVIRGQDNTIRAMSNVCRHRGTLLNSLGKGNKKRMVCPYHAWTYDDQGKLLGVPFANNQVNKEKHCLKQFHIEIWNGFVFINLSTNPSSLKSKFSGINKYLELFDAKRFTKTYSSDQEEWYCNWKLALENAMESYHLFQVHRETLEQVTPTKKSFYLEGSANWSITAGKVKNTESKLLNWLSNSKIYEHYVLISLPPSFVGILTYESFDWVNVLPMGANKCSIQSGGMSTITPDSDSEEQAFAKAFLSEDKAICERVQTGMSAQHSSGGKLVDMERVVVDFHHYLALKLFDMEQQDHYQAEDLKDFFD